MTDRAADDIAISFRIPRELHGRLVEMAKRDMRSLNAQMVVLLRRAVEDAARR